MQTFSSRVLKKSTLLLLLYSFFFFSPPLIQTNKSKEAPGVPFANDSNMCHLLNETTQMTVKQIASSQVPARDVFTTPHFHY